MDSVDHRGPVRTIAALCLALGALGGGFAQTYNMPAHFPLIPGSSFQCDYQDSSDRNGRMTLSITGPVNVNSTPTNVFETRIGSHSERLFLSWDTSFLRVHRREGSDGDNFTYSDPGEILPVSLSASASDMRVGDGGRFSGPGYTGSSSNRVTTVGVETTTIAAGTFQTLHVFLRTQWSTSDDYSGTDEIDFWFVEGLGIVKWERSQRIVDDFGDTVNLWDRWELAVAPTLSISGQVIGVDAGGTLLTFATQGGGPLGTSTADSGGMYSFSIVPLGWTGTVTPSKPGYVFDPPSRSHVAVTASLTGQNFLITSAAPPRDAEFIDHSIPSVLQPSQCVDVTVRARNTGSLPWSEDSLFRVGELSRDSRLFLGSGVSVPQGEIGVFTGTICAPDLTGSHMFRFQLVQDGTAFFGPVLEVPVTVELPPRDAVFEAHGLPVQLEPHESVWVTLTARNRGTLPWSESELFRLAEHERGARFLLPPGVTVTTGESAVFGGALTAPGTPGTLPTRWQMVQDGVTFFGDELAVDIPIVFTGRGDIDASGAVTVGDAALLQGHLLGTGDLATDQMTRADANQDAVINIADMVWILNVSHRAAAGGASSGHVTRP